MPPKHKSRPGPGPYPVPNDPNDPNDTNEPNDTEERENKIRKLNMEIQYNDEQIKTQRNMRDIYEERVDHAAHHGENRRSKQALEETNQNIETLRLSNVTLKSNLKKLRDASNHNKPPNSSIPVSSSSSSSSSSRSSIPVPLQVRQRTAGTVAGPLQNREELPPAPPPTDSSAAPLPVPEVPVVGGPVVDGGDGAVLAVPAVPLLQVLQRTAADHPLGYLVFLVVAILIVSWPTSPPGPPGPPGPVVVHTSAPPRVRSAPGPVVVHTSAPPRVRSAPVQLQLPQSAGTAVTVYKITDKMENKTEILGLLQQVETLVKIMKDQGIDLHLFPPFRLDINVTEKQTMHNRTYKMQVTRKYDDTEYTEYTVTLETSYPSLYYFEIESISNGLKKLGLK